MSSVSSADANNAYLQARVKEVEESAQEVQENLQKTEKARVDKLQENYDHEINKMRDYYEQNAETQRKNIDQAHDELVIHHQNETNRLKKDMYDQHGRSQMQRMYEVEDKARKAVDEIERSNETQLREMEKYYDVQARKAHSAAEERKEGAISNLLSSHHDELDEASRQKRLLEIQVANERAKISEGKVDAIRQYDQGWNEKFQRLQAEHETEQAQEKTKNMQARYREGNNAAETANKKDITYNQIIADLHHDHKEERIYNESAYNQNIKRLERANEQEKAHDQEGRKQQADYLRGQYEESIDNQTKTFNRTFKEQKDYADNEIERTKAENNKLKTSHDPKDMSPAAEEALRRKIAGEYQKNAEAMEERNRDSYDQLKGEYHHRWLEKDFEKQSTEQRLKRENIATLQAHRQDTMNTVRDMEERTRSVVVDESAKMNKREHGMLKKHATEMDMQRTQIQGAVEETLSQAQLEKKAVRSDAEYKDRLKEREFSAKYNDMVKAYERQISDLKDEHEMASRDLKLGSGKEHRDQERHIKSMLEDIERAHKFEMASAEQTRKERERLLEETYQNELAKMRRTNQMLIKKRS